MNDHEHLKPAAILLLGLLLAACASVPPTTSADWHPVTLPGKTATEYRAVVKDGREAVSARSERSASLWRRRLAAPAGTPGDVSFSWWLERAPEGASVGDIAREDAGARVLFAFDGDHARLPARTRLLFGMAESLTGEMPPYATLMYVWDATAPVGTVIVNPRSDRIRKIVVDTGTAQKLRWRDHRRDLAADFRRAFGEEPGALLSVALMTDSDNTASAAKAWYGPVVLHRREAAGPGQPGANTGSPTESRP
jgi:hypothetical protein